MKKFWMILKTTNRKQLLIVLLSLSMRNVMQAQSVGIGTAVPNSKALLDISSTTKGVLFPRMTTIQRFSITSPPVGLMVYDTDKNEMYHYDGSLWRAMLNSEYWQRPITNRKRITNSFDSIGIGTSAPTEWLDVDGNIRSRNNISADGQIRGSGLSTTGGLTVSSNGLVNGYFFANGNLTTNSDLVLNNSAGSLILKSIGVDKAFAQLNGNDLRIGTFSSNNTGKFVVRTNGGDHFTVDANGNSAFGIDPLGLNAKFAVFGKSKFIANGGDAIEANGKMVLNQGGEAMRIAGNDPAINFFEGTTQRGYIWAIDNNMNIGTSQTTGSLSLLSNQINLTSPTVNVDSKLTATTTGTSYNLLPVCYGRVSANGSKAGGTPNFTVSRKSEGSYEIICSQITSSSIVSVTAIAGALNVIVNANVSAGILYVWTLKDGDSFGNPFHFIIIDP